MRIRNFCGLCLHAKAGLVLVLKDGLNQLSHNFSPFSLAFLDLFLSILVLLAHII